MACRGVRVDRRRPVCRAVEKRPELPTPVAALFAFTVTILGPFTVTILGPFTALIEGRNRLDCWRVALVLLPWCAGPLVAATSLQCFWRPTGRMARWVRLVLWDLGIFAWLTGGVVSVLSNRG